VEQGGVLECHRQPVVLGWIKFTCFSIVYMVSYMEVVSVKRDMVQSKLVPFARNAEGRQKKVRGGRHSQEERSSDMYSSILIGKALKGSTAVISFGKRSVAVVGMRDAI
jgi:hypothetical protein